MKIVEILLVEDSNSDAQLMLEILSESNISHRLHWVKNGVEAIDFLDKQEKYTDVPRPDLILLDLNLPKKKGTEVLAKIKGDGALQTIPVIILTTSTDTKDILKSYQLQANCYLVKPVNLEDFIAVVKFIENFWLAAVMLPPKS
ncbi:response regulator [Chroococcus sp. FPU101]|uniref:response regulator n=1 Tax=Chroococcus sp. FPU101 TaxID=1974212 RepID=UPI001A8E80C9|nr:response regulator [Chroococcus sp. FPU101]GFE69951.1 response regulator receiver protein [Chroococcus sp. FPU101]